MAEKKNSPEAVKRPILITILCLIGFIGFSMLLAVLLMPSRKNEIVTCYGPAAIPCMLLVAYLGATATIGLWRMRKWGFYFYVAMAALSFGIGILLDIRTNWLSSLTSVVAIAICIFYFKRME